MAAHKQFIATFEDLRAEYDRDGASSHLVVRVQSELMRWLAAHIKRTDTTLRECIRPQ